MALVSVISINDAFAVDFVDHTGYIPEWANNIGIQQALGICGNVESDTPDQDWCMEFAGYVGDLTTQELDQFDDTDESINNSQINSQYIPSNNSTIFAKFETVFDSNGKLLPNVYLNDQYDFLLIPPQKWTKQENSELIGGEEATPVAFYSNNLNPEYTSNFIVLYFNLGSSNFDLLRTYSDSEVLDLHISELLADSINIKINQKNIESYIDGYKITIQFVQTIKIDENKFLTLQQENIVFLMESGDTYSLNFASMLSDFDENVMKFRKSVDTFAAGEIKFSYPNGAEKKFSGIVTKCEPGIVMEDGKCVTTEQPKLDELDNYEPICGQGTELVNGICQVIKTTEKSKGGGCLIATATYGSELAPQVQQLRELRDNSLLQTASGTSFMSSFNDFYYSFSPTIADWERENPAFKEMVKITLTPMISSLSILNYVDMDSEVSVLGYGVSLILLNVGMYFVAPVVVIHTIRKKL